MAGFFKGVLTGLAIGTAGFVAAALLVLPDPAPRPDPQVGESTDDAGHSADAEAAPVAPESAAETGTPTPQFEAPSGAPAAEPTAAETPTGSEGPVAQSAPSREEPTEIVPVQTDADPMTPAPTENAGAAGAAAPAAPESVRPVEDRAVDETTDEPAPVRPPRGPIAPARAPEATAALAEVEEHAAPDVRLPEPAREADHEVHLPERPADSPVASLPEEEVTVVEPAPEGDSEVAADARTAAAERGRRGAEAPAVPTEDTVAERQPAPDLTEAPAPRDGAEAADAPAWQRHAAAFQASGERPLYAVILIDTPADPRAEAALLSLPAPVTVALDPHDPDAARRAHAYRSAGHEVAIVVSRPMQAGDLAAQLDAIPEAVAWMASPEFWPAGPEDAARLDAALDDAGLALVAHDEDPSAARHVGPPRLHVLGAIDPALETRDEVLAYFERAAAAAGEGEVVALVGAAAHPQMREALMQRAGRETEAPAAPAPLGAALAADRR